MKVTADKALRLGGLAYTHYGTFPHSTHSHVVVILYADIMVSREHKLRAQRRKSPLLESVREAIRVRHYSIRTEQAYVDWIRRFVLFIVSR